MFINLPRILEGCLIRIRQGETMESCLDRYPDSRRELEPLLNTAICIAATPKAAPALGFSRSAPARLVARLQEDRRLEQVRGAQPDPKSVSLGDWLARTFRNPRVMGIAAVAMLFAILGSLTPYLTNLSNPPDTLLSNCTLSIGSGRVEIYVQDAETWRLADNGEVLTTGARLRTSTESQAMLTFFEGSTVLMEPSTEIEIEKLAYSEGGSTTITLKQWMGRTWSRVVTMADPGSHYEIETPSAYALVRGTYFVVDVAQETIVSTLEGLVAVGGQGGEVQVGAGYQTTVTSQGLPAPPTPISDEPSKYTLILASTAGGNVTAPGEGTFTYDAGTLINLQAVPESGYHFVSWGGAVANPDSATTTITMAGNTTVTANFAPNGYTLTVISGSHGVVLGPGVGTFVFQPGAIVNLEVEASNGYRFAGWSGSTGTIEDPSATTTKIHMDGNYVITANFEIDATTYTLTAGSSAGGNVTVPGEGVFTYASGAIVNLQAVPESGYHFVSWSGTVANPNSATTTVTMTGSMTVTANFEIDATTYTLTAGSSAGGNVTAPGEGAFTYASGALVNLQAVAEAGYHFVSWSGAVANPNSATTTVTMTGNNTVTANFEIDATTYTLTAASSAGGNVTVPGEGAFTFTSGALVTLQAVPESGYHFVSWSGDLSGTTNPATMTLDANKSVTATFTQTFYTLQITSSSYGTVTQPGLGTFIYTPGTVVNLMATADAGYGFDVWQGQVSSVSDVNATSTTIVMNGNYTVD